MNDFQVNCGKRRINSRIKKITVSIWMGLFSASILIAQVYDNFTVINPYKNTKPYPYKGSFHNHTQFHPEYTHARQSPKIRLKEYRDYNTYPVYGVVGLSDHNRVTLPKNTVPSGITEGSNSPWGVDNILWIPGNESGLSNGTGVSGHMVIINASKEHTLKPDWTVLKDDQTRSGLLYISKEVPASVEFTFHGTGISWIGYKSPKGGIARVILDGEKTNYANFHANEKKYNQKVFEYNNLENTMHELKVIYESNGESNNKYMGDINLDMLIVTTSEGNVKEYGADNSTIKYKPMQYKHAAFIHDKNKTMDKKLKMLHDDGTFLVLAHPNSRLETKGKFKGMQLWSSSGYTYEELDTIFGNAKKGIQPMNYLPHALEIGNRGYDFSERTGFKNAEEKWDYLLTQGIRVLGMASDDSHGSTPLAGWVVLYTNAKSRNELTKADVMESLFTGNFYSSQGPNIDINVKGNQFTITTNKPSKIEFISAGRVIYGADNVMQATYEIKGNEIYVRGRVTREDNDWPEIGGGIGNVRSAWTNPLYIVPQK